MNIRKETTSVLMISVFLGGLLFYPTFQEKTTIQEETKILAKETETYIEEELETESPIAFDLLALDTAKKAREEEEITTIEETTTEVETETEPITTEEETIAETEVVDVFTPVHSMMDPDLQMWVVSYCEEQDLDPYIVMAVCERESGCTANIMGDNGKAYGMMQIQTRWVQDKLAAHGYTNETMLYAQPNIVIGTEILKDYLDMGYGYEWALMAYNGGIQLVGTDITREYAAWVLRRANELRYENT